MLAIAHTLATSCFSEVCYYGFSGASLLTLGKNKNKRVLDPIIKSIMLPPRMISINTYTKLLIFPRTNVINRFPSIWDDIIKAQKRPNNSLLRFSSATLLVYAPWATQSTDAEIPQIIAPNIMATQTKLLGRSTFATTKSVAA